MLLGTSHSKVQTQASSSVKRNQKSCILVTTYITSYSVIYHLRINYFHLISSDRLDFRSLSISGPAGPAEPAIGNIITISTLPSSSSRIVNIPSLHPWPPDWPESLVWPQLLQQRPQRSWQPRYWTRWLWTLPAPWRCWLLWRGSSRGSWSGWRSHPGRRWSSRW